MEAGERRGDAREAFPVRSHIFHWGGAQLGRKKNPGRGTIDSLFKRPLTLHTLLSIDTRLQSKPPRIRAPRDLRSRETPQIKAEHLANDDEYWQLQTGAAADCISRLDSFKRSTRNVTARPFGSPSSTTPTRGMYSSFISLGVCFVPTNLRSGG